MIELRWLKKKDGTTVLQYCYDLEFMISSNTKKRIHTNGCWIDIPTVKEGEEE